MDTSNLSHAFFMHSLGTSLVIEWLGIHDHQGRWVQSLVRELRSHMLCRAAKRLKKKKRVQSCGTHEVHLDDFLASSLFIHTTGGDGRDVVQKDLPDDSNTHISYLPEWKRSMHSKFAHFLTIPAVGSSLWSSQPAEGHSRRVRQHNELGWSGDRFFFLLCKPAWEQRKKKIKHPSLNACSPSLKARKPYTPKLKLQVPGITMFLKTPCWCNWQIQRRKGGADNYLIFIYQGKSAAYLSSFKLIWNSSQSSLAKRRKYQISGNIQHKMKLKK